MVAALVTAGLVGMGLVTCFVLPPGSGHWQALWNLGRHDWDHMYFWLASTLGVSVVVGVASHGAWVTLTVLRLFHRGAGNLNPHGAATRNSTGFGLAGLVTGFAGFVWVARSNVQHIRGEAAAQHDELLSEEGIFIRGSMTLAEAPETAGLPVATILQRLGWPTITPAHRPEGLFCSQQDMSMTETRERITPSTRATHPQKETNQ